MYFSIIWSNAMSILSSVNLSFKLKYNDNGSTSNQNYSNLFVGKRNIIGAGIGYDFKAFYIDAAYQNVSSEYNSPFIQGSFANNTGYFSNNYIVEVNSSIVSNVKNKKDNFFITLGWKF